MTAAIKRLRALAAWLRVLASDVTGDESDELELRAQACEQGAAALAAQANFAGRRAGDPPLPPG